ncbi:MAG: restriction endonuclease subunit S [Acidobacteriota bacterium]|nr:restriction endonuclease subunit S [Acidobacteriota bacterium]
MNADRFLALYDRAAHAPEAVDRLRRFVLDLAVRGKLVEQDPADEPAPELLKRIEAEEARSRRLQRARRPRRQVAPDPVAAPHDLPPTWIWTQLDCIADFRAGRTPPRKEARYWNTGDFAWVSIADMVHGQILRATKETVSAVARRDVFKREPESSGTMIMSFKLTIGKMARLGLAAFHNEAIVAIRPHLSDLDPFLFRFLPELAKRAKPKGAVKGATLNRESLAQITVPLPPIAEQQRIVAKVDELMALCDRLEQTLVKANDTRSRLLDSLLHEALALDRADANAAEAPSIAETPG